MGEKRKVRATIVFIGAPNPVPKPGEKVELHAADGSWRGGFRYIGDPFTEDGEQRVWVTTEEEYRQAQREGREPAGSTWPLSQIAVVDE
jgi:hypothetical protein